MELVTVGAPLKVLICGTGYAGQGHTKAFRDVSTEVVGMVGRTESVVLETADKLDIPNCEADITPEEFATADEIYFVSTSICLLPVTNLDGKQIGDCKPGPIYQRLLSAWTKQYGLDIAQQAKQFSHREK